MIYEYDGTLAGLWSAYETALRGDLRPDDFLPPGAPGGSGLFDRPVPVVTDFTLTEAFGQRLRAAGEAVPGEFVRVFLAATPGGERLMFRTCLKVTEAGGRVRGHLADPDIRRFQDLVRRVGSETHRYKGLLRFEALEDGLLWASFQPQYNVTVLLAPHFRSRLPHERWLICDVGRGTALHYDGRTTTAAELEPAVLAALRTRGRLPGRTAASDPYAEYWRRFFRAVAIGDRINPGLQRQFMPERLWKWLPEKVPPELAGR